MIRLAKRLVRLFASEFPFLTMRQRASLFRIGGVGILRPGRTYIGRHVYFDDLRPDLIVVGPGCYITAGVRILTHYMNKAYSLTDMVFGRVTIGANVFIGMNALIVRPVTVGDNAIIGAGVVVTKDVPSDSVLVAASTRILPKGSSERLPESSANKGDSSP